MSIYGEISKKNIDWEAVEREIKALGDHINDYADDDSILSELYFGFEGTGDILTKVTKLFLENSFDVHDNGGHNGASCLHALNWSTYDHYVLETAELLLDAGADTKVSHYEDKEDEGVTDSIQWRLGSWMEGDFDTGNIFEAYYEMVAAYEEGRPYKGIRAFRECVGKTVEKVEKISYDRDSVLYDVNHKDAFMDAIVIWADGIPLIASSYIDFIINPYTPDKAVNRLDISEEAKNIIGAKITGLRFSSTNNAAISFDNGYRMRFSGDRAWGNEDSKSAHFVIDKALERCPVVSGMIVDSVVLKSGIHWSETVYKYHEDTMVLVMGDKAYQLYSKGKQGENHSLRMEPIPKEWIGPANRSIVAGKLLVGAVMLNDNNQAVLIHLIDGNENIYITVEKQSDDIIYARTGRDESGEEVYIRMQFADDSEWAKQEFPRNTGND